MGASNRKTAKRIAVLAFLLCFVMAALLSEAFFLTHANHRHDHIDIGSKCVVCAQTQNRENQLSQFSLAAIGVPLALIGLLAALLFLHGISAFCFSSPVYLKTRLNN